MLVTLCSPDPKTVISIFYVRTGIHVNSRVSENSIKKAVIEQNIVWLTLRNELFESQTDL